MIQIIDEDVSGAIILTKQTTDNRHQTLNPSPSSVVRRLFPDFVPFSLRLDGEYIVSGTYQILENRLCISNAHCPGRLKYFIEYLCNKFKTRHILFYNIMNMSVWRLRGFNVIEIVDPILDEVVTCLEGYWEMNDCDCDCDCDCEEEKK